MRFQVGSSSASLSEIKGELTAAVLLIPVALAFQDLVHAVVLNPHLLGGPGFAQVKLGLFFLFSLLCVSILSVAMLQLPKYTQTERIVLFSCIIFYVVAVAYVGGIVEQPTKPDSRLVRDLILLCAAPVSIVVLLLIDLDHSVEEDWLLLFEVSMLACLFVLGFPT